MKRLLIALLIALVPAVAHAQALDRTTVALVEWTQGLSQAYAPADSAMQSFRQIVRSVNGAGPEGMGPALAQAGPQISATLAQVAEGRTAVEAYPLFTSDDAEADGLALASRQMLTTNMDNLERMLGGLQQMHLAATRGDAAGLQRAALDLLPFPAAILRNNAASIRLLALQSRSDLSSFHLLQARASFFEACAVAIDVSRPLDHESFDAHLDAASVSIAAGRVALADQGALLTPRMSAEMSAGLTELIQVQSQSHDVLERAVLTARSSYAQLSANATPEQRIAAARPAGEIERALGPLSDRANAIAVQLVH